MKATSIKEIIQSMQIKDMEILEGVVISEAPLNIKLANNEKMVLDEDILIVPQHLTDYKTKLSFAAIAGAVLSSKTKPAGSHNHTVSGVGSTSTVEDHEHELNDLQLTQVEVTVHNALKKDEKVLLLSYNNSKMYYVLDRVVK
jgi:hypothetical protein